VVPGRTEIQVGGVDGPAGGLVESLVHQVVGVTGHYGQTHETGAGPDGDGQRHPTGPAVEGTAEAENHQNGQFESSRVQRQLPGDPAHGEAGHGERLTADRKEGVDHEDREDHADCEEYPGHPSIQHDPVASVKPPGRGDGEGAPVEPIGREEQGRESWND
jgi:hypothetical protein